MTGMPASLACLDRRKDRLRVLREHDQDLGALRDQRVMSVSLLLVAQVRVGIDVRAAAGLDGLLDVRLVVRGPARLLEVVPRDRDRAVPGRGRRFAGRGAPRARGARARCGRRGAGAAAMLQEQAGDRAMDAARRIAGIRRRT